MTITGGCHCGAISYSLDSPPDRVSVCCCTDCCRNAGAPMVAWGAFPEGALKVTKGMPKVFHSSGEARRSFCPDCGTGLFYHNPEVLPGIADVQILTLDDPGAFPPEAVIQTAERVPWAAHVHTLESFERWPGM